MKMTDFIEIPASNISRSKRKLVCGVGINDADYLTENKGSGKRVVFPYYKAWLSMIQRCYNNKRNKNYKDCSVCDSWLVFSNFKVWMEKQSWGCMVLDKDIIKPNNKIYDPSFCAFVTPRTNTLFSSRTGRGGIYDCGVRYHKQDKNYQAYIRANKKYKHLGSFKTEVEAKSSYLKARINELKSVIPKEVDKRVKQALLKEIDMCLKIMEELNDKSEV